MGIIRNNIHHVTNFSIQIISLHLNNLHKIMPKKEAYKIILKLIEDSTED